MRTCLALLQSLNDLGRSHISPACAAFLTYDLVFVSVLFLYSDLLSGLRGARAAFGAAAYLTACRLPNGVMAMISAVSEHHQRVRVFMPDHVPELVFTVENEICDRDIVRIVIAAVCAGIISLPFMMTEPVSSCGLCADPECDSSRGYAAQLVQAIIFSPDIVQCILGHGRFYL